MHIQTFVDENSAKEAKVGNIIRCPKCNSVLTDIQKVEGRVTIRHRCRRCGTHVMIEAAHSDIYRGVEQMAAH